MDQASLRFCWALLQSFNQHFATAVTYINQPAYLTEILSDSAIPMSIAAYMGFTKSLGLSSIKTDLKQLILDKTSLEAGQPPTLFFERLRIAEAMNKKEGDEQDAEEDEKNLRKRHQDKSFMFLQAYEQVRNLNLAKFRPKKPNSSEPHLAFKIKF